MVTTALTYYHTCTEHRQVEYQNCKVYYVCQHFQAIPRFKTTIQYHQEYSSHILGCRYCRSLEQGTEKQASLSWIQDRETCFAASHSYTCTCAQDGLDTVQLALVVFFINLHKYSTCTHTKQRNDGKQPEDIEVDMKLSVMKPLSARWIISA